MKIRKTALWGYSKAAVRKKLDDMQEAHRIRMQGLEEELHALKQENERLDGELYRIEEEMTETEANSAKPEADADNAKPHQETAERLLQAHLEQNADIQAMLDMLKTVDREQETEFNEKRRQRQDMLEEYEQKMRQALGRMFGKEEQR